MEHAEPGEERVELHPRATTRASQSALAYISRIQVETRNCEEDSSGKG